MNKKKILFFAYDLNIGGIEKALINLVNTLDANKYNITVMLEKKQGIFLSKINKNVKVIEYSLYEDGNPIIRKIKNRFKLIKWIIKNKNKYDFSCSFATYSKTGARICLNASKNSNLWIHGNYYKLYNNDENKLKLFLDSILIYKFKRNIYVSNENLEEITSHYQNILNKSFVCNNLINHEEIIKLSNEKIEQKKSDAITFVNVGRHEEFQKRLTRIIDACEKLRKEGFNFKVLLIGDGPDNLFYKKCVSDKNLNDIIKFLGSKKNPYPYYKLGDATILSSYYEGFPVVFLESMVLNKPIISTKVSDWDILDKKYGIFVENNDDDIYYGMKEFLIDGFNIQEEFDCKKYNEEVIGKIEHFINN